MKCTRQRCHVAWKIFAIAALSPECESEMTSLTPRKPRRVSERKKSVQNGSASLGPTATPKTSRTPSVLTPTGFASSRARHNRAACRRSASVGGLYHVSGTLTDYHTRCHCISHGYSGHDRRIGYPKTVDAVDAQPAIDD